jgi:hypothetical protein
LVTCAASFWIRSLFKSTIDREGVTLQPPQKERSFKWRKKIATNSYRKRERERENPRLRLFIPISPVLRLYLVCARQKKKHGEQVCVRPVFPGPLCVCIKRPGGEEEVERETQVQVAWYYSVHEVTQSFIYIYFFSYFDSLINLLGTEFRKEEANTPTCRVR